MPAHQLLPGEEDTELRREHGQGLCDGAGLPAAVWMPVGTFCAERPVGPEIPSGYEGFSDAERRTDQPGGLGSVPYMREET